MSADAVEVVVLGLNVVDVLVRLPRVVVAGEKYAVDELVVTGGAPAGNAACVLAALGWHTAFVGHFGRNTLSDIARVELTRCGVRPDLFLQTDDAARPAVAVVQIDPATGERTVFYTLAGYRKVAADEVPTKAIASAKLVLVDGYEAAGALAVLRAAREADVPSVVDVESGDTAVMTETIGLADHCILPLAAARSLTDPSEPDDVLAALRAITRAQLIVTDGPRGSWGLHGDRVVHQSCFPVDVVDTTGCGDAYHGAYAAALLDGFPLAQRMEFAAWVAAQVATGFGGRAVLPSREQIGASRNVFTPALRDSIAQMRLMTQ